jgi:hypothetical protein
VLMYVLALPPRRRLAVMTTVRSGEVYADHPLQRWLADTRRQPGFTEVSLDRLDRPATAEQLAGLLGRPPRQALVDDVYTRTRGNAYLNVLLSRGLDPDADAVPTDLPDDLRQAVVRAWHGLSAPARALTRLIAVAGRPTGVELLSDVGFDGAIVPALRAAVDAGVLEVVAGDRYWFVHPLLAEVLEDGLLPDERRVLHAAFATALKARLGDVEQTIDLADDHHRAGHVAEAFGAALRGAEVAEGVGGATEGLRLLRRALDLLPSVPDAGLSRLELLTRIRAAADRAGDQEAELAAIEAMLTLVDRDETPLVAAELLVRRKLLCMSCARHCDDLDDMREAVRLTAPYPASMEHALAMSERRRNGRVASRRRASGRARRSGWPAPADRLGPSPTP